MRIDKIKLPAIHRRIIVAKTLSQNVEIESVQMNGVILHPDESRVLQHDFHRGVELELLHSSRFRRVEERSVEAIARIRVVELQRRVIREIGGVNPTYVPEKGFQHGQLRRELKRRVVHAGCELQPERALTGPVPGKVAGR